MNIPPEVLTAIRERAHTDGTHLTLTGPRFDPALYERVNEVLEAVGGRWTAAVQAHVFPMDANQALAPVLETEQVVTLREKRQQAQYFPTPPAVVQRLIDLAGIQPGMKVLEPSAGSGAIANAIAATGAAVDCIERDPGYAAVLADAGHDVRAADFLTVAPEAVYDRVVMNPPFTKGADMQHVEHALQFLKPGGLLVSVMSWTVAEPTARTAGFRALVEDRGGTVEAVDKGAFRESGTDVPTVIVTIPAVRAADAVPTVWPARETPMVAEPHFGDPAAIAAEICADLRTALRHFDAVAASLAAPASASAPAAKVVALPSARGQEQLSFDGLTEAS